MMTNIKQEITLKRELLMSVSRLRASSPWCAEVAQNLGPAGFGVFRSYSRPETLGRVARGGLAGAIVDGIASEAEAFSLVRGIRAMTADLPCWIVVREPTRRTLETALTLDLQAVVPDPVDVEALTGVLSESFVQNGSNCLIHW